jgi:hypothetical protein
MSILFKNVVDYIINLFWSVESRPYGQAKVFRIYWFVLFVMEEKYESVLKVKG